MKLKLDIEANLDHLKKITSKMSNSKNIFLNSYQFLIHHHLIIT